MIKKIITFWVLLFWAINLTTAERIINDAGTNFTVENASEFTQKVLSSSAWILNGGWMSSVKPLILLQNTYWNHDRRYIYFWWTDNKLYAYWNQEGTINNPSNFEFLKFTKFIRVNGTAFTSKTYSNLTDAGDLINAESFYNDTSLKGKMTRFAYLKQNDNSSRTAFCRIYDNYNFSICVKPAGSMTETTTKPNGVSIDPVEFNIDWIIGTSPRVDDAPEPEEPTTDNRPNTYYCPTVRELMSRFWDNYYTWMCYSARIITSGNTQTVERQSIFEIFTDYTDYTNRINIYNNNCRAPYTLENCRQAFTGNYNKQSIISNLMNQNGVEVKNVWNYCNMWLNYDPNTTTCVGSGIIAEPATNEEILEAIVNWKFRVIAPNKTGTVMDYLLTWNQTRTTQEGTRDVFWSLENIYNKITTLFRWRSGKQGIIPPYIMWICFATILFTIIFKK